MSYTVNKFGEIMRKTQEVTKLTHKDVIDIMRNANKLKKEGKMKVYLHKLTRRVSDDLVFFKDSHADSIGIYGDYEVHSDGRVDANSDIILTANPGRLNVYTTRKGYALISYFLH